MAYEPLKSEYAGTTTEVFDPYGLMEDDDDQTSPSAIDEDDEEPYCMLSGVEGPQSQSESFGNGDQQMTAQEQWLGDYWSNVLNVDTTSIRPKDNFFDLGGTSLEALKLGAATHHNGLLLAVPDILRHPTLSEMAKAIQRQNENHGECEQGLKAFSLLPNQECIGRVLSEAERVCHIDQAIIEDVYPCTPLQKGMMALSLLKPGAYLEQHVYTIPKTWNLAAFQAAWQTMANANPIFRTRIIHTEECGWVQVLVEGATKWTKAQHLEKYLAVDCNVTMDLGDPLVRCALIAGMSDDSTQFVLTIHHAVEDGWSMSLLPQEITEAYQGLGTAPKPGYKSFVKYTQELNSESSRNYWCSELAEPNPVTFPRLPSVTYQPLANRRVTQLIKLLENHSSSITISNIIRAAWSMIVARYVDSSDVTIGVTMSGRSLPMKNITSMMGPTIATMPVRLGIDPESRVQDFLEAIQRQSTEMIPHEQYGLQNIQSLNKDTHVACNFQNLLVVQPMLESNTVAEDGNSSLQEVSMDFPNYLNYAFTLECTLTPDGIRAEVGFDEAVIDVQQVRRVILQFENVLHQLQMESNWHKNLRDIELASPADKDEIMSWTIENPVVQTYCVHHLIKLESLDYPESPAICAWDGDMTYAELERSADKIALELVKNGVGPEIFVLICLEKSLWTVVAILAVMKAGGAFVLLDPSQPLSRLELITKLVGGTIALASPQQLDEISTIVRTTITIEHSKLESLPSNESEIRVNVKPDNALYVTFTSGTTGEPKGSVTEHVSCASAFKAQINAGYFSRTSRVLQFASYSFDTSIEEILATLMAGGCICIPSEKERLSDLSGAINRMNVNLVELTASATSLVMPESVPSLKILRQGGEPMTTSMRNLWSHKLQLENSYGPSECCVTTTVTKMAPDGNPNNIGKGVNCVLWIVEFSDYTRLAPIGTIGELLIQGPNVSRGYLKRDAETAAAFIASPELPKALEKTSQRLYKTGDMAKYNSDGSVSILGRKDAQVKLRGQRIELGEIEHQIFSSDLAAQVVVIKAAAGPFLNELVAVLQLRDGPAETDHFQTNLQNPSMKAIPASSEKISSVRRHLELHLPSYMIPTAWIVVHQIPISVTGKCNRKAVSSWVESVSPEERLAIQAAALAPVTDAVLDESEVIASDLSAKLAELVSDGNEQLRSSIIGKDVLVSYTGINSISIVTLASYIKQKFGTSIDIEILTDSDLTVRQLAEHVRRIRVGEVELKNRIKIDLAGELSKLQQSLLSELKSSKSQNPIPSRMIQTVFVTGTTGYLGTYILKAMLFHPQIKRVIAHVRAATAELGMQRIIDSAKKAGWWTAKLLSKLEVWIGNLGANHLGLTESQWEELVGRAEIDRRVDAMIHNGAAVNWYKDYAALEPTNVTSTLELLQATASSPFVQKFVYVSGGPHWDDKKNDESDEELLTQVTDGNGYCQTKIVSELLTKYFGRFSQDHGRRISIVKPGYIIGTASKGIANIDDFLWRLVAGAISIRGVEKEDAGSWVFMATVDSVADRILSSLLHEEDETTILSKILDGFTVGELWSTLTKTFNYSLNPIDGKDFYLMLQEDVNSLKEEHPLWPVMHLISQGYGTIGSYISPEQRKIHSTKKDTIRAAVISNIEYLIGIGFLPDSQGKKATGVAEKQFNRT